MWTYTLRRSEVGALVVQFYNDGTEFLAGKRECSTRDEAVATGALGCGRFNAAEVPRVQPGSPGQIPQVSPALQAVAYAESVRGLGVCHEAVLEAWAAGYVAGSGGGEK